ncbi:hypothetical protein NSTC745_06440 [Nostoc sp. DSM 114161]|jgi:hypothetical protein|uniref:hypothetical protein n=1 Tax=Nostoc sp. DSM 114161 TaxID=3440143 RepID=UPI0040464BFD
MAHPVYSKEQLEKFSRNQLWEICDSKGITRRRSCSDCINDILKAQQQLQKALAPSDEQAVAQTELEAHIKAQAEEIALENQRLAMNQKGYQDAVAGLEMQSGDPCYRMGFERGFRDISPIPADDSSSQAIVFEKVANGRWQANVNGVLARIASVKDGYKTNLTGDMVLVDFGIAIKESLLAVARLQTQPEKPALEVFATTRPNVYAVYSHKSGQESKRYEVDLKSESCTCPHYEHRHDQEGFKDKHIEAVKIALSLRTTPLLFEEEMLLDKPFDELTAQDWQQLGASELELVAA